MNWSKCLFVSANLSNFLRDFGILAPFSMRIITTKETPALEFYSFHGGSVVVVRCGFPRVSHRQVRRWPGVRYPG